MSTTQRIRAQHNAPAASITRPANTIAYAAGDVITDGNAVALTFSRCSGEPGHGGAIRSVILIDSANQTTKLNADLFLFSQAPASFGADNAAFTPTDTELEKLVGVVSLDGTGAIVGDATAGAAGNLVILTQGQDLPFTCEPDDSALYGVLVARNAYTPVSGEKFTIRLGVEQG